MRPMHLEFSLTVLVLALTVAPVSGQTVLYVDDDAPPGGSGTSWATAFDSLQDALAAAVPGDEIRVAQGTYRPDYGAAQAPPNRTATFQLLSGVAIRGAYAGLGAPDPDARDLIAYESILSGDLLGDDLTDGDMRDNSFSVVTCTGADATAVIDGCVIERGYSNAAASEFAEGAGLRNNGGSPTIIDCTFRHNRASYGGGMYTNVDGSPTLIHCAFVANQATYGAGLYGTGATVLGCRFIDNGSSYYGGGIYV
ncbi:MAG: hypothetical protein GY778_18915, partial [bacterium]|nr:hypothetical protein [bacterium]